MINYFKIIIFLIITMMTTIDAYWGNSAKIKFYFLLMYFLILIVFNFNLQLMIRFIKILQKSCFNYTKYYILLIIK